MVTVETVIIDNFQPVIIINPFHVTDLLLYPLKTLENQMFSDVFRGYQKRSVVRNGLTLLEK